ISVIVLAVAMRHRGWLSRRQFRWGTALLVVCLIGSQSKAAFFVASLLGIFYLMWTWRGWRRWALIGALSTGFVVAGAIVNLPAAIDVYVKAAATYQQLSNLHPNDGNL